MDNLRWLYIYHTFSRTSRFGHFVVYYIPQKSIFLDTSRFPRQWPSPYPPALSLRQCIAPFYSVFFNAKPIKQALSSITSCLWDPNLHNYAPQKNQSNLIGLWFAFSITFWGPLWLKFAIDVFSNPSLTTFRYLPPPRMAFPPRFSQPKTPIFGGSPSAFTRPKKDHSFPDVGWWFPNNSTIYHHRNLLKG